jgi:hypothetical protein
MHETFFALGADIVFSEDCFVCGEALTKMHFGQCSGTVANAGMFMGFARSLASFLQRVISQTATDDDQKAINLLCHDARYRCKVDKKHVLFENLVKTDRKSHAYVVSYPFAVGQPIHYKIKRVCRDYSAQVMVVLVAVAVLSVMQLRPQILSDGGDVRCNPTECSDIFLGNRGDKKSELLRNAQTILTTQTTAITNEQV